MESGIVKLGEQTTWGYVGVKRNRAIIHIYIKKKISKIFL